MLPSSLLSRNPARCCGDSYPTVREGLRLLACHRAASSSRRRVLTPRFPVEKDYLLVPEWRPRSVFVSVEMKGGSVKHG